MEGSFNSRSRVGSDPSSTLRWPALTGFNSRSRGGSDALPSFTFLSLTCFNSRSRVGSDNDKRPVLIMDTQFQFTLPCRERPSTQGSASSPLTFQFTLPCRERLAQAEAAQAARQFQFPLPCRERRIVREVRALQPCFNSRSRVGSDAR